MDFRCRQSQFKKAVSTVQNAVGSKASMNPIVENILLVAEEDSISLVATNLRLSVRHRMSADVETTGKIAVAGRVVGDIAGEMLGEEVHVSLGEAEDDQQMVVIDSGRSTFRIHGVSPDEFPPFMVDVEGEALTMPVEALRLGLQRTVYAASSETSRFELDGIKIDATEEGLRLVATDGRRLCLCELPVENVPSGLSALIPSWTCKEALRVLPAEGDVRLVVGEGKVVIECGDVAMVSNLLEDNFPPYESIIPSGEFCEAKINREELLHAVRSIDAVTDETSRLVRFRIDREEMELEAEHANLGRGRVKVPVEFGGEESVVGYRSQFVIDVLRSLDCETVSFSLDDNSPDRSPVVVRAEGDDRFLCVIMPMRLPEKAVPKPDLGELEELEDETSA